MAWGGKGLTPRFLKAGVIGEGVLTFKSGKAQVSRSQAAELLPSRTSWHKLLLSSGPHLP